MLTRSSAPPVQQPPQQAPQQNNIKTILICLIIIETILVALALIPAQLWTRILPHGGSALNGPFPAPIAPVITFALYITPTVIGYLCRNWQRALLYATLPAWIGLGLFVVAATARVGAFYLVSSDHVTANVSLLELFAALGGIGWLARNFLKMS